MHLSKPRSRRIPVIREDGKPGGYLTEHWDDHVDATVCNTTVRMVIPAGTALALPESMQRSPMIRSLKNKLGMAENQKVMLITKDMEERRRG